MCIRLSASFCGVIKQRDIFVNRQLCLLAQAAVLGRWEMHNDARTKGELSKSFTYWWHRKHSPTLESFSKVGLQAVAADQTGASGVAVTGDSPQRRGRPGVEATCGTRHGAGRRGG